MISDHQLDKINRSLSLPNQALVNRHRSLTGKLLHAAPEHIDLISAACSLMTPGPAWRAATKLQESIIALAKIVREFSEIPFYGLERALARHQTAGATLLGAEQHQELTRLTQRIFRYLHIEEAASIWLHAAVAAAPDQPANCVTAQQAEQQWQQFLRELPKDARIDRRIHDQRLALRNLQLPETATRHIGQAGCVLQPAAGKRAVTQELELKTAGSHYVAIGRY